MFMCQPDGSDRTGFSGRPGPFITVILGAFHSGETSSGSVVWEDRARVTPLLDHSPAANEPNMWDLRCCLFCSVEPGDELKRTMSETLKTSSGWTDLTYNLVQLDWI